MLDQLYDEIQFMNTHKYPLFLELYEIIDNGQDDNKIYLIEQLADGIMGCVYQNIYNAISDQNIVKEKFPNIYTLTTLNAIKQNSQQLLIQMTQVSLALMHLHELNLVHGDLKQSNILKIKGPIYILGDFGLVQDVEKGKNYKIPVSIAYQSFDNQGLTKENDVWCFGVLFFMNLTGYHPSAFCCAYAIQNQLFQFNTYQQYLMTYNEQIFEFTFQQIYNVFIENYNTLRQNQNVNQVQQQIRFLLKLIFECFKPQQERITIKQLFQQILLEYLIYFSSFYQDDNLKLDCIYQKLDQFQDDFDHNNTDHVLFVINYCNALQNKTKYQNFFLQKENNYNIFKQYNNENNNQLISERLYESRQQSKVNICNMDGNIKFETKFLQLQKQLNKKLKNTNQQEKVQQGKVDQIKHILNITQNEISIETIESDTDSESSLIQSWLYSSETVTKDSSIISSQEKQLSLTYDTNCELQKHFGSFNISMIMNNQQQKLYSSSNSNLKIRSKSFNQQAFSELLTIKQPKNTAYLQQSYNSRDYQFSAQSNQSSTFISENELKNEFKDLHSNNLSDVIQCESSDEEIAIQSKKFPQIKIQKTYGQLINEKLGLQDEVQSQQSVSSVIIRPSKIKQVVQDDILNQSNPNERPQIRNFNINQTKSSSDDVLNKSNLSLSIFSQKCQTTDRANTSTTISKKVNYKMQQRHSFYLKDDQLDFDIPKQKKITTLFQDICYEKDHKSFQYNSSYDQNKILGLGSYESGTQIMLDDWSSSSSILSSEENLEIVDITEDDNVQNNINKILNIDNEDPNILFKDGLISQGTTKFKRIEEQEQTLSNTNQSSTQQLLDEDQLFLQKTQILTSKDSTNQQTNVYKEQKQQEQNYNIKLAQLLDQKNLKKITLNQQNQQQIIDQQIQESIQYNQIYDDYNQYVQRIKLFENFSHTSTDNINKGNIQNRFNNQSKQLISMRYNINTISLDNKQLKPQEKILYFSYCYNLMNKLWVYINKENNFIISEKVNFYYQSLIQKQETLFKTDANVFQFKKEDILQDFIQLVKECSENIQTNNIQKTNKIYTTLQSLQKLTQVIDDIFKQKSAFLVQPTGWIIITQRGLFNFLNLFCQDWNNDDDNYGVNLYINNQQFCATDRQQYHNIEVYVGLAYAEENPIVGIRHKCSQRTLVIQTSNRPLNMQVSKIQAENMIQQLKSITNYQQDLTHLNSKYYQFSQIQLYIPNRKWFGIVNTPIYELYYLYVNSVCVLPVHLLLCILDLIDNCRNYSPDQSTIRLCLFNSENYFYMIISDMGIGLEQQDTQKQFYSANYGQIKAQFENLQCFGCGMGLKHLQVIIDAYKGLVNISSTQNGGTKIIIKIKTGTMLK